MSDAPEPNPWTRLERRTVYDNRWITVFEDRVIRPDGQPGVYGVVHFKNRAIGILPVDEDGSLWLVGQYRYTLGRYSWEIPEGGAPEDESPRDAARRELREETGLIAERLEPLATVHLSNSVSDEVAYVFRATGLRHGQNDPEGTEQLQVRRVAWSEAWRMLQDGAITDSMSVVALLHEAIRRGVPPEVSASAPRSSRRPGSKPARARSEKPEAVPATAATGDAVPPPFVPGSFRMVEGLPPDTWNPEG